MAKLKVKQVIRYVKSGVNFENNLCQCLMLVIAGYYITFGYAIAWGQGGPYWTLFFIPLPLSLAAVVATFIITARPRTTLRRLLLNLLISVTTVVNAWSMSLVYCFIGFGVNGFSALVFLPSIVTAMLLPIKVQKDLREKSEKCVVYGAVGAVTGVGAVVGVVMGRAGKMFGETMLNDMTQVQAYTFLLAVQIVLSCCFMIGTIGNSTKLYWYRRLRKKGVAID